MHALIVTSSPALARGEELLKAIGKQIGLTRIRFEKYLCPVADRHVQRLVGRVKRVEVLVDQSLPLKGVPYDYQAHIALRGKDPMEEYQALKRFEEKLTSSGYTCQLLASGPGGDMRLVSDLL